MQMKLSYVAGCLCRWLSAEFTALENIKFYRVSGVLCHCVTCVEMLWR